MEMAYFKSKKEIKEAMNEDGTVKGEVIMSLDTIIEAGRENFHDKLAEYMGVPFMDIYSYEVSNLECEKTKEAKTKNLLVLSVTGALPKETSHEKMLSDYFDSMVHGYKRRLTEEEIWPYRNGHMELTMAAVEESEIIGCFRLKHGDSIHIYGFRYKDGDNSDNSENNVRKIVEIIFKDGLFGMCPIEIPTEISFKKGRIGYEICEMVRKCFDNAKSPK